MQTEVEPCQAGAIDQLNQGRLPWLVSKMNGKSATKYMTDRSTREETGGSKNVLLVLFKQRHCQKYFWSGGGGGGGCQNSVSIQ